MFALRSALLIATALCAGAIRVQSPPPAAAHEAKADLSPPLDPSSDKKFFGPPFPADYPHDEQPASHGKSLPHAPYPKLQATDEFHKDLTKDENGDGGKWESQMAFDIARHKLKKEQSEMEKAAAEESAKEAAMKKAEVKAKAAAEKAAAAKAEAEAASAAKAKAEKEAGGSASEAKQEMMTQEEAMKAKVAAAEAEYEKEKKQFANCQQELDDARAKLEALKADKDNLVKTDTAQAKLLKIDHTMIDQEKVKEDAALAKLAKAERERDAAEAEAAKVKAENEKAMRALAKEQADVQAVERQLHAAEGKLQGEPREKGRSTGEDKGWSGETEHPFYEPSKRNRKKSGASARALSQTVVLVAASAALSQLF